MTISRVLRIFLPFAFGFYVSYLFRSINAVIAPDLIRDIGLGADSLGLLSSVYFISFAIFQIPLGIILDRQDPRKVEAFLLFFAALGAVIFALSDTLTNLVIGRALIGLGVSACLMASFKSFVVWFPKERLALANGTIMMTGGLGALTATAPIEFVLQFTDWRGIFLIFSVMVIFCSTIIYFIVPDSHSEHRRSDDTAFMDQIYGLCAVIRNTLFQRYVLIAATSQGSMLVIQSLWMGPWLRDVAGFSRVETASGLFIMTAAMMLGFLFWGIIGERLGHRGITSMKIFLIGVAIFGIVQIVIICEPNSFIIPILMLFGFFGTAGSLSYAGFSQSFPAHLSGRVHTTANLLVFLFAFIGQWGVGIIINLWPPVADGHFSPIGYQVAFATILSVQVIAFLWIGVSRLIWPQI
jgi:predicted MFS family arabinose efflux permease